MSSEPLAFAPSPVDAKISVIMPAYNESVRIAQSVKTTADTLTALGYDFEVVVVDDGSSDATATVAEEAAREHPGRVRVVGYNRNRGKGGALICGTRFAHGDYIVFLDADMDLHPEQIPVFIEIMAAKKTDIVIGSKRHPLSCVQYPFHRKVYSTVYYGVVRALFGLPVKDTQTGLKVFRNEVLRRVCPRLKTSGFAFDIELLANAHRLGYRMCDAPVSLNFQRQKGRIRLSDVLRMAKDTLNIFYRMRIRREYDGDFPVLERHLWPDHEPIALRVEEVNSALTLAS